MAKKRILTTRQEAIQELVQTEQIEDQQTLIDLIKNRFGIETSQAAVSRDLRALGIGKRNVGTKMIYQPADVDVSKEILRLAIVQVQHNESLIIIHTLPGLAAFVADYLDLCDDTGIMATLSGENSVFITPESIKNIKNVYHTVCSLVFYKETK